MNYNEFADKHNVTLSYVHTDKNPYMEDSANMDNYEVTLTYEEREMCVYYSKGVGHNGEPPTVDEVLNCLAMDSASVENSRDFEDFCNELGYDTDSRRAERTYKACVRQAKEMKALLGDEIYNMLLWETEEE